MSDYEVLDPRAPRFKRRAQILSAKLGVPNWIQMSERIAQFTLEKYTGPMGFKVVPIEQR